MLVADFTASETLGDTNVKLAGGREGQEEGGMPYQEGSPSSIIPYVPIFGGFRLAWIKHACE